MLEAKYMPLIRAAAARGERKLVIDEPNCWAIVDPVAYLAMVDDYTAWFKREFERRLAELRVSGIR